MIQSIQATIATLQTTTSSLGTSDGVLKQTVETNVATLGNLIKQLEQKDVLIVDSVSQRLQELSKDVERAMEAAGLAVSAE